MKKPTELRKVELSIPHPGGEGTARVATVDVEMEWDGELEQWLLTPDGMEKLETFKAAEMGLLLPEQLKELRERHGCTQREMGELFQVGEKSWTRWESGKYRPSRSINLLIRALYDSQISIGYLLERVGRLVKGTWPNELDLNIVFRKRKKAGALPTTTRSLNDLNIAFRKRKKSGALSTEIARSERLRGSTSAGWVFVFSEGERLSGEAGDSAGETAVRDELACVA